MKLNWKNEKGSFTILAIFLFLCSFLLFGFLVDIGRMYVYKHQLQSMADAASLAGASAVRYYHTGTGVKMTIDEEMAEEEAKSVIRLNAANIYGNRTDRSFVGWMGEVRNNGKSYYVRMSGKIRMLFHNVLGMEEEETVTVESQSKIVKEQS